MPDPPPLVVAREDPSLGARILRTLPLHYVEGADVALDRPAHVRAGSGLAWVGGRLAVVQDDAAFLALVDPDTGEARAVTLPAAEGGVRQFDELRGNKRLKADFEACVAVPDGAGGDLLLAFGSGSTPLRERVLVARGLDGEAPRVEVVDASALYHLLRERRDFAGSELNVEGAALVDGALRLFNRGNGAPCAGLLPVDATCDLDLSALVGWLCDHSSSPPQPETIVQYNLGEIGGMRLTFTDAASAGGALLFTATAEDSPDTYRDGPVAGSAVGVLEGGAGRWTPLRTSDGGLFAGKVEGLAPSLSQPGRVWIVVDRDDPAAPSDLCEVELTGPWPW